MKMIFFALILTVLGAIRAYSDVEWTRFKGTVKAVNLRSGTLRLQNSDGDVFDIPIDYQVKIMDRKNVLHDLKDTELDSKVTLIKVISEKPKEENEGLVPYHGMGETAGETTPIEPKRRNK